MGGKAPTLCRRVVLLPALPTFFYDGPDNAPTCGQGLWPVSSPSHPWRCHRWGRCFWNGIAPIVKYGTRWVFKKSNDKLWISYGDGGDGDCRTLAHSFDRILQTASIYSPPLLPKEMIGISFSPFTPTFILIFHVKYLMSSFRSLSFSLCLSIIL
jgi:hypothetical protein